MQTPASVASQVHAPSSGAPRRWPIWVRAIGVVVAIEVGLLLLTLPWTPLWTHSGWAQYLRASHASWLSLWLSPYLRGAVSGLGLINLWLAASEITPGPR